MTGPLKNGGAMRGRYRLIIPILVAAFAHQAAWSEDETADGGPQAPVAAPTVKAAEWKKLKKAVPHVLWVQKGKRRTRARRMQVWERHAAGAVTLSRKQFGALGQMLRAGNPFTTVKRRSVTLNVETGTKLPDGKLETMPVRIEVSSKYKPGCGRCFPLIITCHGGPQSKLNVAVSASSDQFRLWGGYSSTIDCIVAAPALTGSKYGDREWTFLTNLIDMLDERYSVDRDRILLTGHSWGGILTWHIGPPHADTFSVLAPFVCAVNPGRSHLANCRALPIYHVQGSRDMKWMVDTGRERDRILTELGYEHLYRERPGGHDQFPGEVRKVADWFMERPRKLYAHHLVRSPTRAGRNDSDLWYWIRSETHAFEARVDPKARTIDVNIDGPFEVFLADEMLDLDRPFEILRSGESVWKGVVQRRLDFAVEHVRETGDHGRVFAASVKVP